MSASTTDVLVVGGGPAGTAAAIRLARAGHSVTLLERRAGSWDRARGDLHPPPAVAELDDLGLTSSVDSGGGPHRLLGVRSWHGDRSLELRWPNDGAPAGIIWPRHALDEALRSTASRAGVDVRLGTEAVTPIVERGFVRGAVTRATSLDSPVGAATDRSSDPGGSADADVPVEEIRCRFLVIADGARSRFGRALGTHRDRRWPYTVSAAAYFASDLHTDPWADEVLGPLGPDDDPVTGHGWIHPMGDGRLSVGVNVSSAYRDVLRVNVVKLLDRFARTHGDRWGFDPDAALTEPARVRTPAGGSVAPTMGPTFLVVGDAAGMANPLNGHGNHTAFVTARLCAEVLDEALTVGNSTTLQRYPALVAEELAEYQKVARLAVRFLGRPAVLRTALRFGIANERVMGAGLRIANQQLRTGPGAERGGTERLYRNAARVARFLPSW